MYLAQFLDRGFYISKQVRRLHPDQVGLFPLENDQTFVYKYTLKRIEPKLPLFRSFSRLCLSKFIQNLFDCDNRK